MTESADLQQLGGRIKEFVMNEFLPGEDPNELTPETALISGGILDSLATVKLIAFLEEEYGISFESHEISADYLDTLPDIAKLTGRKITESR